MVMRKSSPETDQMARSLLQKAIRRGNEYIANATFEYLAANKEEFNWLRARLTVFTFEEAWPYGLHITFSRTAQENLKHILTLCSLEKNKDAAGLGSLAYAYSEGDNSVLSNDAGDWYIRVVAKAIKERDKFRAWALGETACLDQERATLVLNALEGSKKAGWPWDKAFTYAAALLAIKKPIPFLNIVSTQNSKNFPFWVAIDKHTTEGKVAIRKAAKDLGIPANTALWLSFYFESAKTINLAASQWWERERAWRFSKLALSESDALSHWSSLQPIIAKSLGPQADELAERIFNKNTLILQNRTEQKKLF